MRNDQLPSLMEKDELVKVMSFEKFAALCTAAPRRLSEQRFFYAILSIKQGNGECLLDNELQVLQPGTLMFVTPFQFLQLKNVLYLHGTVILFTEEFLCRNHLHEQALYRMAYGKHRSFYFHLEEQQVDNNYIQSQLSMFHWEYRLGKDTLLKFDLLHNILLGIIIYIHKLQLDVEGGMYDLSEPMAKSQMIQFLQLVNTHYREESTLQFYADALNISQEQLAQLCKKAIGWSPKAILQEKILREAKRLLLFDMMSVKQIGYHLGFKDPTYFVKFFQQHTGISPKNFRSVHCVTGLGEGEQTS